MASSHTQCYINRFIIIRTVKMIENVSHIQQLQKARQWKNTLRKCKIVVLLYAAYNMAAESLLVANSYDSLNYL